MILKRAVLYAFALVVALLVSGCDSPEGQLVRGNNAYLAGNSRAAEAYYLSALRHDETRASAAFNLGRISLEGKDGAKALEFLDVGLRERPDFGLGRLYRGQAELSLGRMAEARRDLRKAVLLDPSLASGWLTLARMSIKDGDMRAALSFLGHLDGDAASLSESTALKVDCLIRLDRRDDAANALAAQIQAQPYEAGPSFDLGHLLLGMGDYREAERRLLVGLAIDPGNREGRLDLADALDKSGRRDEAEVIYRQLLDGGKAQPQDEVFSRAETWLALSGQANTKAETSLRKAPASHRAQRTPPERPRLP